MKKLLIAMLLIMSVLLVDASENQTVKQSLATTTINRDSGSMEVDGSKADMVKVIRAVIMVESMGNPKAVNKQTNCYGLMQVEQNTYIYMHEKGMIKIYEWDKILEPAYNIQVGVKWLDWTYRFLKKELPLATPTELLLLTLVAYNKGVGATIKEYWSNGGKPKESYRYYTKFIEYYRRQ